MVAFELTIFNIFQVLDSFIVLINDHGDHVNHKHRYVATFNLKYYNFPKGAYHVFGAHVVGGNIVSGNLTVKTRHFPTLADVT